MIGSGLIGEIVIGSCAEYEIPVVPDTSVYFSLGGHNLAGHVVLPVKPSGMKRSVSSLGIPTRAKCRLSETGMEPLKYDFQLIFSDKTEADAFRRLANGLSEDIAWCGGRSDYYQIAKYVSVSPAEIVDDLIHYLCDVSLELENPMLIRLLPSTSELIQVALPVQTTTFENDGTFKAPLKFVFDARYAGGKHLNGLTVALYDGVEVISTALLSDSLLSTERLEFSEGDTIKCTYVENFGDPAKLALDKYASSGLTEHAGHVHLASGGYLTYKFFGPNPTLENILLQATFTIDGGSPLIQVSTDNATWKTAVAAADMKDGYHDYYLDQSDKVGDIYIRIYCPSGATLTISFMRFIATRTIVPDIEFVIPAGDTYSVNISDGAVSSHEVDALISFQPRSWP